MASASGWMKLIIMLYLTTATVVCTTTTASSPKVPNETVVVSSNSYTISPSNTLSGTILKTTPATSLLPTLDISTYTSIHVDTKNTTLASVSRSIGSPDSTPTSGNGSMSSPHTSSTPIAYDANTTSITFFFSTAPTERTNSSASLSIISKDTFISKSVSISNNIITLSLSAAVSTKVQTVSNTPELAPFSSVQSTQLRLSYISSADKAGGKTTSTLSSSQTRIMTSMISKNEDTESSTVHFSVFISPSSARVAIVSSNIKNYVIIQSKFTIKNRKYEPELQDPTSPKYEELSTTCKNALEEKYDNIPGFKAVTDIAFSKGSIIVTYRAIFATDADAERVLTDMNKELEDNKLGNFIIYYNPSDSQISGKSQPQPEPEPDLPQWAFYTLIGGGCLLLILIITIICLCVKLRRQRKESGGFPTFMDVLTNDGAEHMSLWDNKIRAKHVSANNDGNTDPPMKELNGTDNKAQSTWYSGVGSDMTEMKENLSTSPELKSFYVKNEDSVL